MLTAVIGLTVATLLLLPKSLDPLLISPLAGY